MRTNIVLDDTLMNKALKIGGLKTKKAAENYRYLRSIGITVRKTIIALLYSI